MSIVKAINELSGKEATTIEKAIRNLEGGGNLGKSKVLELVPDNSGYSIYDGDVKLTFNDIYTLIGTVNAVVYFGLYGYSEPIQAHLESPSSMILEWYISKCNPDGIEIIHFIMRNDDQITEDETRSLKLDTGVNADPPFPFLFTLSKMYVNNIENKYDIHVIPRTSNNEPPFIPYIILSTDSTLASAISYLVENPTYADIYAGNKMQFSTGNRYGYSHYGSGYKFQKGSLSFIDNIVYAQCLTGYSIGIYHDDLVLLGSPTNTKEAALEGFVGDLINRGLLAFSLSIFSAPMPPESTE